MQHLNNQHKFTSHRLHSIQRAVLEQPTKWSRTNDCIQIQRAALEQLTYWPQATDCIQIPPAEMEPQLVTRHLLHRSKIVTTNILVTNHRLRSNSACSIGTINILVLIHRLQSKRYAHQWNNQDIGHEPPTAITKECAASERPRN